MPFGIVVEGMNGDVRGAVAAETVAATLLAPLAAGLELAEAKQQRVEIQDAFGPQRVAGDMADSRQPLLLLAHAERLFRQADGHAFGIENAHIAEVQTTLLFDDRHVRHQSAIALQRRVEIVDLKTEMMQAAGAAGFMQLGP